jgi:hypothetical protein
VATDEDSLWGRHLFALAAWRGIAHCAAGARVINSFPGRQPPSRTAMPPLPPEPVYLPFETGPYRMAMALTAVPEAAWFEIDALYPEELAERQALLAARHAEVFAALPCSDAGRWETLRLVAANLALHHPAWFHAAGDALVNRLTGESWDLRDPGRDPLEVAGLLVQEDLCIIQVHDGVPLFTAAVLCFPSRWRLGDKIGRPLAEVHGPVPIYADRLERPVDRFMRHLKGGHIASRLNWSILDDPALFQPTGKWRTDANTDITRMNAGARLYLRVERQTLRRLPDSDAILFGIRVHRYRLDRVITTPALAARLAEAVRALPDPIVHYKSLRTVQDALLGWLTDRGPDPAGH